MAPRIQLWRAQAHTRSFTSTSTCLRHGRTNLLAMMPVTAPPLPPYPYPAAQWYKQQETGLYGGAVLQYGNNVSEKHNTKTPRRWLPNIKTQTFYSRALDQRVRMRVTTAVMRTIEKLGGIDSYVIGHTTQRVKELGPEGWKLRWAVLHSPAMQERMKTDANLSRLTGPRHVPPEPVEGIEAAEVEARDMEEDEAYDAELEPEAEYTEQRKYEIPGGIYRPTGGHMAEAPAPPPPKGLFGRVTAAITRPFGRR